MKPYCESRFKTIRRITREVRIGDIKIGAQHPIAVQSMTTTKTEDVDATLAQARELAEAGCDVVRITAPSMKAARALKEIQARFRADGFTTPLVADIHFLPKAAMEAVEHVEKVRINPGNFADYKKFKTIEYTDQQYQEEIERLHESFTPFILRCKELGRAIRIGTNHGSLSDRIMNRYGDTPEGMVESALEFIRIAESHNFHDIVLSMKASNPKVMISAYRLAVARMQEENMAYPLHLGVTEAGDGEDARVKSCIGIGSLLADGLGDTLRVSLTEDPVHEVPVGRELARWTEGLWAQSSTLNPEMDASLPEEQLDFYHSEKQKVNAIELPGGEIWDQELPCKVAVGVPAPEADTATLIRQVAKVQVRQRDARIEYWIHPITNAESLETLETLRDAWIGVVEGFALDIKTAGLLPEVLRNIGENSGFHWILNIPASALTSAVLDSLADQSKQVHLCADFAQCSTAQAKEILEMMPMPALMTLSAPLQDLTAIGSYRTLVALAGSARADAPPALWLRNTETCFVDPTASNYAALLMESSILSGTMLCEGLGNLISVEQEANLLKATALAYNILQGARARISKTEFVACPSCGRTLFDLQSTTQKIRSRTAHLKGVTIAIMGCIVNGPGEMADADFGYVGGAPGKVNLYVGKSCVKVGIAEAEAVDALIALIQEHGKWVDPEPAPTDA